MHLQHDEQRLADALTSLELLEPQAEELLASKEMQEIALHEADLALADWKQQWSQLQQQIAEPTRQLSVETSRIHQLEQQISRNQQRLERIEQQQAQETGNNDSTLDIEAAREQQLILTEQLKEAELQLAEDQQKLTELQQTQQELQQQQNQLRSSLQSNKGRLSSLETLQQAGLGKDNNGLKQWLKEHKLDDLPRLAEQIKVDSKWEVAVEKLLGPTLEELSLPEANRLEEIISATCSDTVELIINSSGNNDAANDTAPAGSLAHHIQQPLELKRLVASVYCADDHQDALKRRESLNAGEQLVTPDGSCYSRNWIRLSGQKKSSKDNSVLARQKEIESLQQQTVTPL